MGKRIDGIFITRKFEVVWDLRTIEEGTLIFRPSTLVGCPHAVIKSIDKTQTWNDSSMRFFAEGTRLHSYREHQYKYGVPILLEKRMYIRNIEHGYILTGQPDYIGYDHKGYFILDFKSTSYKNLYYKWKDDEPFKSNGWQLAIYNFIHYMYSGIEIKNGMLHYIVRMNHEDPNEGRHFYNKPYPIHSLEKAEEFIERHPAINYLLDRKNAESKKALSLAISAYHKENSFFDVCSCGKILKAKA